MGQGIIPQDAIEGTTVRAGVAGSIDSAIIKHVSGGKSRLILKSFDSGREAFQGSKIQVLLLDEEPPMPVYTEGLTRLLATSPGEQSGILMAAFTPLLGLSDVVLSFLPDGKPTDGVMSGGSTDNASGKWFTIMPMDEAPHIPVAEREKLAASYMPHEREARLKGLPSLGSGAIYPIAESDIVFKPFELPDWHRRCYALDVGWNRTAVLWGSHDQETDTIYIYSEHYVGEQTPANHAAAIRARGSWINGVIDPAARGRTQTDGQQLIEIYRQLGLTLTPADNGVESGIYTVWSRLSAGRLKIFSNMENLLQELRIYRRDEKGRPVKANDHLVDCLRYLCASGLDVATAKPQTMWRNKRSQHLISYDPMLELWKKR
jgi:phage terminase large subunit-like protein